MPKRILQGTVESAKSDKTVSVMVERRFKHLLYKKIIKRSTKYAAHDADSKCKVGDRVKIQECRPMSKTKSWIVID
ncbi:30S ribosomal protein S17 [Rickettsiaceae bacterium]|nr:30S ribosomal protein S17 [Rickettsiaceae bacterium]